MRRIAIALTTGALVLAAFAAPASAAPTKDFSVNAKQYEGHRTHGGGFAFRERLRRHGHLVGKDHIKCDQAGQAFVCAGTWRFRHGVIFAKGPINGGKTQRLPITGGKGRYKGAKGELVATRTGRNRERETFNFK